MSILNLNPRRRWLLTSLFVLGLQLPLPASAQRDTPVVLQPVQPRLQRVLPVTPPIAPSVSLEAPACLPVGENGVVTARVRHEPVAAQVRIFFRRMTATTVDSEIDGDDFYFVNAHPMGEGVYSALLPRPTADTSGSTTRPARSLVTRRPVRPQISEPTARRRRAIRGELRRPSASSSYEPVQLYAELKDPSRPEGIVSARVEVAVTDACESPTPPPVWGEASNLTLGETALWQADEPPFHFECTGIQRREWFGGLFADPICRDYFVAPQPRLQTMQQKIVRPGEATFHTVEVFYGTDRARSGSSEPADFYQGGRGPLELGTCEVTIPFDHEVGELESPGLFQLPDPEKHILLVSVTPRGEGEFVGALQDGIAASTESEALVFVHGYNVSFEDAARRTAQMKSDLEFTGPALFYSWPSQASLAGYPVDEANNRWTVPHLEHFLDLVVETSGAERIHLIAHSMGNRAVTEVLLRYAAEDEALDAPPRFNQIALVAPDVDSDVFRDEIAPRIQQVASRVTLYASANDKALKVSRGVHGHPRAGDLSSGIVAAQGIETIDASGVDTSLLNAIGLGHSYFAEQPTVIDDLKLLLDGLTATERNLTTRFAVGLTYWELSP